MTRSIAKLFAAAAIAISLFLVTDSIYGLSRPVVQLAASSAPWGQQVR